MLDISPNITFCTFTTNWLKLKTDQKQTSHFSTNISFFSSSRRCRRRKYWCNKGAEMFLALKHHVGLGGLLRCLMFRPTWSRKLPPFIKCLKFKSDNKPDFSPRCDSVVFNSWAQFCLVLNKLTQTWAQSGLQMAPAEWMVVFYSRLVCVF